MRVFRLLVVALVAVASPGLAGGARLPWAQMLEPPFQPEPPDFGLVPGGRGGQPLDEPFFIRIVEPADDGEVLEDSKTLIRWDSGGPIEKVRLYYSYHRCGLAGGSRGDYGRVLYGQMLPNLGEVPWTIPWMDTDGFRLRIAAYDESGHRVAAHEIGASFRPAELNGLPEHAIAIIKKRQRLYYYQEGRIRRMHIVSTAAPGYTTPCMRPGSRDRWRGAMGQVFGKQRSAWSRRYTCWMPYWLQITASGSHGIHATSPRFYYLLGRPASHGCVRQHRSDAKALYDLVEVGTPVYVF